MNIIDLHGTWQLSKAGESESIPMEIPGDTHSALYRAGKIPNPYWGKNELDLQYLNLYDWTLTRTFIIGKDFLSQGHAFLELDYLDTVTEIRINGELAGRTDNMFVRHRLDIRRFIREGENTISITFYSAEEAGRKKAESLGYEVPYMRYPVQSGHRNMIRKIQCHAGWDWGPCFMVSGIYGSARIVPYSGVRIENVWVTRRFPGSARDACELDVHAELYAHGKTDSSVEVTFDGSTLKVEARLSAGLTTVTATFRVDRPRLWWPIGMGEQHLYDLDVKTADESVSKKIGIRKVELVTEKDDAGRTFFFRINDVETFAKGANWIPVDALPAFATRERYERLLADCAFANMNMLRVWGGGQYEFDHFYEECDRLGIMVWQDFMFSCSLYPVDEAFLANVREEVDYQVKRLLHYACVTIFCGNNENEVSFAWFEASRNDPEKYHGDYRKLYYDTIRPVVASLAPDVPWWPSSPSKNNGLFENLPAARSEGDSHTWDVWHRRKPFDDYMENVPRFGSEYGFQSFPSLETVRSYAPEDQFDVLSEVMLFHQRSPNGNQLMNHYFDEYFRKPESFEEFLYLSQVQQAYCIKTGTEYWRAMRPYCMGALYWQLNDNWPVASWSSIEHDGRWKLLHYAARKFFAPLFVCAFVRPGNPRVDVHCVNDSKENGSVRVLVGFHGFDGSPYKRETIEVRIAGCSSVLLKSYDTERMRIVPRKTFLYVSYEHAGESFDNQLFLALPRDSDIRKPGIRCTVARISGNRAEIVLSTDVPAFFVGIESRAVKGRFSDNCLTLMPGTERRIVFEADAGSDIPDAEAVEKGLVVSSLR